MYIIKEEKAIEIKKKFKQITIAKDIGISISHLCLILKDGKPCRKPVAYCITKYVDSEAEIEDYFVRV